jgi:hypothetical protein
VQDEPGTFDLLGFTHYWGKSRKGHWIIKRKTAAKRQRRTLKGVASATTRDVVLLLALMFIA